MCDVSSTINSMLREAKKEKALLDSQYYCGRIFINEYLSKVQVIDAKVLTLNEIKEKLNILEDDRK